MHITAKVCNICEHYVPLKKLQSHIQKCREKQDSLITIEDADKEILRVDFSATNHLKKLLQDGSQKSATGTNRILPEKARDSRDFFSAQQKITSPGCNLANQKQRKPNLSGHSKQTDDTINFMHKAKQIRQKIPGMQLPTEDRPVNSNILK